MTGLLAALCLLANCDSGVLDQGAAKPAVAPPGSYQLYVQVAGIDFARGSGGTLFTIRTPAGRVVASAGFPRVWNSYCANDLREMHLFTAAESSAPYTVTGLPKTVVTLKTSYAFAAGGALHILDRANLDGASFRQYRISVAGSEVSTMARVQAQEQMQRNCALFIANGRYFYHDGPRIRACPLNGTDQDCENIAIVPGTFPYVYAEHGGRVLVGTNWGDILIHGPEGWCRAENVSERYACPPSGSPLASGPATATGVQFYSSIHYQAKTYLGKFPDGLLYEFNGESMVLSADSLPSLGQFGTELQSLAIYCGDLFAGLYPRGMVWRRDRETSSWKQLARLFSHPAEILPWVPYFGMDPSGGEPAFYGQRVTSLALLSDSLFASTANLNSWNDSIGDPDFMTVAQAAEYGTLHRIRRPGCASARVPDASSFLLRFNFTPETITVHHGGTVLVKAENNGTVPDAGDRVSLGEGVFGTLSGVALNYWAEHPHPAPAAPRPAPR
jgi:hypothetical protein